MFRYDPNLWIAGFLLLLAVMVIATIALAISTRLSLVVNVVVCSGIFLFGLFSDYLFGRFAATNFFARVAYGILPNLQVFWMAEALKSKTIIPLSYVASAATYGICYMAAVLIVALYMFHGRQVS
ncbi:unnamed protein product [marine sediment metagenome]|uniref:Uncharacterized protein n=1 Tax=marine sediment metagenome TaxID=412755 RepID=X0Y8M6_9ZZZZ